MTTAELIDRFANDLTAISEFRKTYGEDQYFCMTIGETNKRCSNQYDMYQLMPSSDPQWSTDDSILAYHPMFQLGSHRRVRASLAALKAKEADNGRVWT